MTVNQFEARKRERFLEESSYTAFVRSTQHVIEECTKLLETELEHSEDSSRAYTQWTAELMTEKLQELIGNYSAGAPIPTLGLVYPVVLTAIESNVLPHPIYRTEPFYLDELDTYAYAMWLLSLCKLLRLDPLLPRVAALFDVAKEDNRGKDALFEALLGKLGLPTVPAKGMLKNLKAHPLLLQAIEAEPKKKSLYVAEFLKKWYPAMKATYWHDRHRRVPQNFFGYWAFEAGLVTLLWDIDDSGYRDLPFYPKDLVDYARQHPDIDWMALGGQAGAEMLQSTKAGDPCPRTGWWSTPAQANSRQHFEAGTIMPSLGGDYGATIWQWDAQQG